MAVLYCHEKNSPIIGLDINGQNQVDFERTQKRNLFGLLARYRYTIETGSDQRRETFEWRRSARQTLKSLASRKSVWELVKLESQDPNDAENVEVVEPTRARQGKQVLASATIRRRGDAETKRQCEWTFRAGVAPREYGERWFIMTLMTFADLWMDDACRPSFAKRLSDEIW